MSSRALLAVPTADAPAPGLPERPTAPFLLSLLGGIAILVSGVLEIDFGAADALDCPAFPCPVNAAYLVSGIVGTAVGAVCVVLAVVLYVTPAHRVLAGVLLIILSILSLVSFFGAFGLGFITVLLGGILAISWAPGPRYVGFLPVYPVPYAPAGAEGPRSTPVGASPTSPPAGRVCPRCGRSLEADARFCSACGQALP